MMAEQPHFAMADWDKVQCTKCRQMVAWNGGLGWKGYHCPACRREFMRVFMRGRRAEAQMTTPCRECHIVPEPDQRAGWLCVACDASIRALRRAVANAKARVKSRAHRLEHRDEINAQAREQWASMPADVKATINAKRADYQRNKYHTDANERQSVIARVRAWKADNPDRNADHMRAASRNHRGRKNDAVCEHGAGCFAVAAKMMARKCAICGSKKRIEADHIVPLSRGGLDCRDNIQPLCKRCNTSKQARDHADFARSHGRLW